MSKLIELWLAHDKTYERGDENINYVYEYKNKEIVVDTNECKQGWFVTFLINGRLEQIVIWYDELLCFAEELIR